jgi:hypothetical protein
MKKLLLLAVLAALAGWYFDGSRRITEDMVRENYQMELEAMRNFDAPLLCKRVSDDFLATDTVNSGDGPVEQHLDKQSYCHELTQSIEAMRRISGLSRGRMTFNVNTEIKSITLAANHKSAAVELVSTVKLGDMILARSRGTETLIRRNGHILSTGGEFKSWAYSGE